MQMKKRVKIILGKGGNVELSYIGNEYLITSFSDIDDYFFCFGKGSLVDTQLLSHCLDMEKKLQPHG